jgi:acyl carrier protein
MKYPSFENLVEVTRDSLRLKRVARLDPDTQFIRDLGITETQGIDLLKAIETHYGIELTAEPYDRMQSECSFHSKAIGETPVIQPLFGTSLPDGSSFTVGQL